MLKFLKISSWIWAFAGGTFGFVWTSDQSWINFFAAFCCVLISILFSALRIEKEYSHEIENIIENFNIKYKFGGKIK